MKPKKVTAESEREERVKAICDEIIYRAAKMMTEEAGASMETMLDRVFSYAGAQSCKLHGSAKTAKAFRAMADNIEAGVFHYLTGENENSEKRH